MRIWSSMSRRERCLAIALVTVLVPLAAGDAQGQMLRALSPPTFVPDEKAISAPLIGKGSIGSQEVATPVDVPTTPPPPVSVERSEGLCDGLTAEQKRRLPICAGK